MAITAAAGGGNWSAGGTWVGGVAPGASDDVLLTITSGAITIDGTSGTPNLCRSLNCTGYTNTLTQGSAAQLNIGDGTVGAFTLVAGMTYAPNAAAVLKFVSTTGTNNITTAAKRVPLVIFDGVGGTWQFQDGWDNVSGASIALTNGTLQTNGQTVGNTSGCTFSSNNSNTRALTLGATTWKIPNNSSGGSWNIINGTGMTLSAASSTITFQQTTQNFTFSGGGLTYGIVTCTTLTTGTMTIDQANTFGTLTLGLAAGSTNNLSGYSLKANQTITGTFTANGTNSQSRVFIYSNTLGTARTITAATVTTTWIDLRDITGSGAGSWNLSAITGGSGDAGGNSGITFNTPKNCFMKTAVSVNWDASNWFTTSGGSTPISPVTPLIQDTAFFDINSVTATSKTITNRNPRLPAMDWSNIANTPAFATGSSAFEIYGSMILVSGMTHTGTGGLTFSGRGSTTFEGGTLTWPTSSTITLDNFNGTLTQQSNFTSNSSITVTSGTWAGNGKTINCTTCTVSGGTFTPGGTLTLAGALLVSGTGIFNGSAIIVTGGTTFSQSSSDACSIGTLVCSSTFSQTGTGTLTIGSGGVSATNYTFSGASTRTINMGSGTWAATSAGTVWDYSGSNVTWIPSTSTITITDTSASTKTFSGGAGTYNNLTISGAASNGTVTISGSNTFNLLTLNPDASILFTAATTQTVTDLLSTGTSGHNVIIASTTATNATINSSSPVDVDYMTITDMTAAGNTPFYAGANSTDGGGGNVNWTFTVRPVGVPYRPWMVD